MKELISRLSVASVVIGNLPQLPGYNGSVLTIDDTEAATIEKTIDDALELLRAIHDKEQS